MTPGERQLAASKRPFRGRR